MIRLKASGFGYGEIPLRGRVEPTPESTGDDCPECRGETEKFEESKGVPCPTCSPEPLGAEQAEGRVDRVPNPSGVTIHLYREITGGIEITTREGETRLILNAAQARALADLTSRRDWKIASISPTGKVATSDGRS